MTMTTGCRIFRGYIFGIYPCYQRRNELRVLVPKTLLQEEAHLPPASPAQLVRRKYSVHGSMDMLVCEI